MMVEIEEIEGIWCFRIGTNLDAVSAPDMHSQIDSLREGVPQNCIVDLTGTEFMDSSGVGALVKLYRRLCGDGGRLCLCAANGQPKSLIGSLQIEKAIPLYPNPTAATMVSAPETVYSSINRPIKKMATGPRPNSSI